MAECKCCKNETTGTAMVYVGEPARVEGGETKWNYTSYHTALCDACLARYQDSFSGLVLYLALQLGWLSFAKLGFTTMGLVGALLGAVGLARICMLLAAKLLAWRGKAVPVWLRGGEMDNEEQASAALKACLKKSARFKGKRLMSIRDYKRMQGSI